MDTTSANKPVVVVTGSTGLIGTRTVEALAADYSVVGLDLKPADKTPQGTDFIECDLTKDESVADAFGRIRQKHGNHIASVIHLAAYYNFSGEQSEMYRKLTVEGTSRMLRNLHGFDTDQFVFSSTMIVMEPAEKKEEEITETSPLEDEPWAYPRSKIETEELIKRERGEIPTVILRLAGVYSDEGDSLPIGQQISRIYEKKFDSFFFPGDASRGQPFIHLDDVVECLQTVVKLRHELKNEVFLVSEPTIMSYEELQEDLGTLIHGKEWPAIRVPKIAAKAGAWVEEKIAGEEETFIKPWMIDLADAHYPVAIDHARNKLEWEPRHSLRNTLPKMIATMKRDPEQWFIDNGIKKPGGSKA